MNQLTFETNYSDNGKLREKLYPLFNEVFGIEVDTFKDFYSRGFWDPTYIPFTYFDNENAVANVSLFDMPIMLKGRKRRAAGIQSVMTHPYYRGKGLMNSLLNRALEYIDSHYEMAFLMTSNPEIYEKYEFVLLRRTFIQRNIIITV